MSSRFSRHPRSTPRVAVIGAGALGGWTALHLVRRGARVTLVDAWGPGNARSSSGDSTRVIRAIYGGARRYIEWTARSLALWRESERAWRRRLFHRTGALWMFHDEDSYARSSVGAMRNTGLGVVEMGRAEAVGRFPQISFRGIRGVFLEPQAGYLAARAACEAVLEAFVREGGSYRRASVSPLPTPVGEATPVLTDGTTLPADLHVFACGAWLGHLFPALLSGVIRPTRQEVFYFRTPEGDRRFHDGTMPVWIDMGERIRYGIPARGRRGFKFADDTRGVRFDPTEGDRVVSTSAVEEARRALSGRFPALAGAPLLEARVCPYEDTPDGHFVIDHHPARSDVWIVGGGSGHAFKMAPALGEHAAAVILGGAPADPLFGLRRFSRTPG